MSKAEGFLDIDDINNLKDIYDLFISIISKCDFTNEDYQILQKTGNNLNTLLTELASLKK